MIFRPVRERSRHRSECRSAVIVTEGHNVQVLSSGVAVEDGHVLVVAIQFEQGQAHVGGLLVAELS